MVLAKIASNVLIIECPSTFSFAPLPDLYFDSSSYPVAPIVSSAGAFFKFTYPLLAEPITNPVWKATGFLDQLKKSTRMYGFLSSHPFSSCSSTTYPESSITLTSGEKQVTLEKTLIGNLKISDFRLNCAYQAYKHVAQSSC